MRPDDLAVVARSLEAQGDFAHAGGLWAQAGQPGQAARSFLKVLPACPPLPAAPSCISNIARWLYASSKEACTSQARSIMMAVPSKLNHLALRCRFSLMPTDCQPYPETCACGQAGGPHVEQALSAAESSPELHMLVAPAIEEYLDANQAFIAQHHQLPGLPDPSSLLRARVLAGRCQEAASEALASAQACQAEGDYKVQPLHMVAMRQAFELLHSAGCRVCAARLPAGRRQAACYEGIADACVQFAEGWSQCSSSP